MATNAVICGAAGRMGQMLVRLGRAHQARQRPRPAHVARDALMPERGTLDVSKARNLIEYDPHNPLEVGYCNYIRWYREFFERVGLAPATLATAQVNE